MRHGPRKLTPISAAEGVEPDKQAAFAVWVATRPDVVRKLADEFPIGTVVTDIKGDDWYVIGWDEADSLVIAPFWIGNDYDAAMSQRRHVHAGHLRNGELKFALYKAYGER